MESNRCWDWLVHFREIQFSKMRWWRETKGTIEWAKCQKAMLLFYLFSFMWLEAFLGVPVMAQWKWIWLVSRRTQVPSRPLLRGLRVWRGHELWCGSQMWLAPGLPPFVLCFGRYTSDSTPSLGTSLFHCFVCKRKKNEKKNNGINVSLISLAYLFFRFTELCLQ